MVVRLVIERDNYSVVCIVHIIEDTTAVLIKRAGCYQPGYLRAGHPYSVPPSTCGFSVNPRAGDMGHGYFDPTSERPELVHAFNFEDGVRAANRYADQWCSVRCDAGENTAIGNKKERSSSALAKVKPCSCPAREPIYVLPMRRWRRSTSITRFWISLGLTPGMRDT